MMHAGDLLLDTSMSLTTTCRGLLIKGGSHTTQQNAQ